MYLSGDMKFIVQQRCDHGLEATVRFSVIWESNFLKSAKNGTNKPYSLPWRKKASSLGTRLMQCRVALRTHIQILPELPKTPEQQLHSSIQRRTLNFALVPPPITQEASLRISPWCRNCHTFPSLLPTTPTHF